MDYNDFLKRIRQIKEVGFVQSHRVGDTGIGKTLEDLLGITENNIAGPDFEAYELKSGRKDSVSMLTLFTKAPKPEGANRGLLEAFGYAQRKSLKGYKQVTFGREDSTEYALPVNEKELHVTVDAVKTNSVGLRLMIDSDRIHIWNEKSVEAYYDKQILKEAFEKKYHRLIYVLADNKKEKGSEFFWFNEAYLLEGFSFSRFSLLIDQGTLKVDIRLGHYPDGRPHDHGTGFRILPRYLPQCFERIEQIL